MITIRDLKTSDIPLINQWMIDRKYIAYSLPPNTLVAEDEGEPVGSFCMYLTDAKMFYLDHLVVSPEVNNPILSHRIVSKLIDSAIERAKSLGIRFGVGVTSIKGLCKLYTRKNIYVSEDKFNMIVWRND